MIDPLDSIETRLNDIIKRVEILELEVLEQPERAFVTQEFDPEQPCGNNRCKHRLDIINHILSVGSWCVPAALPDEIALLQQNFLDSEEHIKALEAKLFEAWTLVKNLEIELANAKRGK